MMLEHAGHPEVGRRIVEALEATLEGGTRTADLGGEATTEEFARAVISRLDA